MAQLFVKDWTKGLITRIEKESTPRGGASDMLNWHFFGDRIELRRGQKLMGTLVDGNGRVTFVRVGRKYDGTQIPFWGHDRKVKYYDAALQDSVEVGTDMLPVGASGEDISHTLYQSIAGSFLLLSSPNSSVYKIPIANPGSAVDQLMDTFRGYIKATLGRVFLFNRKDKYGGADRTGLYVSSIDKDSLADFPFTSSEDVGTGDGVTTTFTGTLAFKAAAPKKTAHFMRIAASVGTLKAITGITQATSPTVTAIAHGLSIGDSVVIQGVVGMTQINNRIAIVATVPTADTFTIDIDTTGFTAYGSGGFVGRAELFTDDRSGGLTGSLGGTGTMNYATGAFSITFSSAPANGAEVVADYYTEDATDADSGQTNSGAFLDFNEPNTPLSIADSLTFRQDDAGFFMGIGNIGSTNYCLHTIKTYALRLISTADITNLVYREKVGVPYFRAFVPTGEGIYYLDATDPKDPTVRILEISLYTSEVVPRSVSDNLSLIGYLFDLAVMFEWGDYIVLACRTEDSTVNNRAFMLNRIWKTWEVHSLRISDMDSYQGALLGGDSGSNNLYKLFSGVSDEEANIENFYVTGDDDIDVDGIKDIRRMVVAGWIGDDQENEIAYSVDNEPFVVVKSILGTGPYVDHTQRKLIGSSTLGEEMIGGGEASEDAIFASPYKVEFPVGTKRLSRIRLRFEAKALGYLSVSEYGFVDVREKGRRMPVKYVT